MRILPALLALLPLTVAACGDSAPDFGDALTALEQAEGAVQSGDSELAMAGFEYAAANAGDDKELLCKALLGMGALQAQSGALDKAEATYGRIESECAAQLTPRRNERLVASYITAGAVDQAKAALASMQQRHPSETELLNRLSAGIEAAESGDAAALSELGYAGD